MQSSCSLQHVPVDLERETKMDASLKKRLAFAKQKLVEINAVAQQLASGKCPKGKAPPAVAGSAADELQKYDKDMLDRPLPYEQRRQAQFKAFPKVRTRSQSSWTRWKYMTCIYLNQAAADSILFTVVSCCAHWILATSPLACGH